MTKPLHALPFALALAACSPAAAQDGAANNTSGGALMEEQACYDVLHYDLALAVDPDAKEIEGTLTMTARVVDASREIALHLDDLLNVRAVRGGLAGEALEPLQFKHSEGVVFVESMLCAERGAEFRVAVDYFGAPRIAPNPPWEGGFTWSSSRGEPWFVTSCQGEGADLWWPCKDHPSDKPEGMDLAFTVPAGLVVATNGRHLGDETDEEAGTVTSRWRVTTPISNYAVALNVGPYVAVARDFESVSGETFPVTYWVLEANREKGEEFIDEIVRRLASMERFCGPYPFRADKYGVVETPHLGMEHQTIIAYGNRYRGDPRFDYDWLHHHELAHEWWGNLVTARDWCDFWIHEGIGTYMQPLYLEEQFGREAYQKKMKGDLLRVLNRAAIAPRAPRTTDSIYFAQTGGDAPGGDIYFKGSWVCHSLRWALGDEAFFEVLRRWAYPEPALEEVTDGSHCRLVTTDELIGIAERVTERELDWFFDVYVKSAPLPRLEESLEGGVLTLRWDAPGDGPFPMPVEVFVDGEARRVEMPGGEATVEVGDAEVAVDPDLRVLRTPR